MGRANALTECVLNVHQSADSVQYTCGCSIHALEKKIYIYIYIHTHTHIYMILNINVTKAQVK